jgi:predicted phage terminase large subunit-like protein
LDVVRERLDYPDLKRKVMQLHFQWRNTVASYSLLIENKGSGMSLIQDLRQNGVHSIAINPEGDKTMRMNAQTARIEAGAISLPKQAHWLEEFRREITSYPAGRHTDQIDAFSQALNRAFDRQRAGWGAVIGLS